VDVAAASPSSVAQLLQGRWFRLFAAGVGVVLLVGGISAWWLSTRPADPLNSHPGLGFEGAGVTGVPVGQRRAFVVHLIGDTPASRATITGFELPRIPGVRLALYAVIGSPQDQFMGFPISATPHPHRLSADQLVPLAGRSLQPPPASFGFADHRMLTIALVATPLQPGCYRITGVAIRYRVGDTTFTKSMAGADSISTTRHDCI
jgi:hypothetical protein